MSLFRKKRLLELRAREKEARQHTIMIIDDEEANLKAMTSLLSPKYNLLKARDGQEALEYIENMEHPEQVNLIISDQRMPRLTGTQLFERLIPIIPNTIRIILTGYIDISAIIDSINNAQIYKFIVKPFEPNDLLLTVDRALEAFDLQIKLDRYYSTLEQKVEERTIELKNKNTQITSSIRYAQTIQSTILPDTEEIRQVLPEHFVIFKPKDIVSGDFYWFNVIDEWIFLAVVDCTGHGVPAAFMSMMGYILLNKIIVEQGTKEPATILEQLHLEVRSALKQRQGKGATDGMEMGLCRIQTTERKIAFAGAKVSLLRVNDNIQQPDLIKGNRKAIGGRQSETKRTFTTHYLEPEPGDMIYMATDGFADQSNVNQKKFGAKRLRELLAGIAHLDMRSQEQKLLAELTAHQGEEEQRDDITIVGARIRV